MDGHKSGEECLNKKIVAIVLLFFMSLAVAITPSQLVLGQSQNLGVTIFQVSPQGQNSSNGTSVSTGPVGYALNLQGTIYTSNGTYQVIFASQVVASGTSDGYYVNSNFSVPEAASGTYALRLRDVTVNVNSTENDFQVTTSYIINPVPSQIQEGSSLALDVTVTGGNPTTSYFANVSAVLPSPLNTVYSKVVSLGTTSQKGTASAQVTFPDTSFQPNGSVTDYSGSYLVYFNQSNPLAQSQFSVGFLDSSTYHRGQPVTIRAVGYQPNQAATLDVTNVASSASVDSESITASTDGVISKAWVVPSNVGLGDYKVTITPQGTEKSIQDSQTFSITGYPIQIKTINLANEVVSQIQVQALDQATNIAYNSTSGADGIANLNLEAGTHALTAFWNGVNVGGSNITVTGNGGFTLQCKLTDLKILVQNQNGVALPFVDLAISYKYQQANGGSQTGTASGQTDLSGAFVLKSTLTGISYTVDASLYNEVFNSANNTFNNIPSQPVSQIVITCPNEKLTINVVDYNKAAIPNTRIELVELTNSLFYAATTDSSGSVTSQVSFGMYRTRFYKDNILINQTNIKVFGVTEKQIQCTLYGIQVSISVVDFFGRPISNANVTLNGPETERFSALTKGDGTTTFSNVVGGDMQIVAFAPGAQNDYQAVTLTVSQPTSVQVKIDRYVVLGSLLIQVSSLFAILVILIAIIILVIVEIYRRKRVRHTAES
jgi:hypothetical protein